jgi:hypothetical protein
MIAHFPVSKSAIIFGFVSKVVTALGLLALLIDGTDTGTDFVVDSLHKERNCQRTVAVGLRYSGSALGGLKRAARPRAQ